MTTSYPVEGPVEPEEPSKITVDTVIKLEKVTVGNEVEKRFYILHALCFQVTGIYCWYYEVYLLGQHDFSVLI